jgi:hypothetical protein
LRLSPICRGTPPKAHDPTTNDVAKKIAADPPRWRGDTEKSWDGIAVGEGAVWVITDNKELRRYSAEAVPKNRRFPSKVAYTRAA